MISIKKNFENDTFLEYSKFEIHFNFHIWELCCFIYWQPNNTKKWFYFSVTYFVKKFNLYVVYFIWRYTIWIKYDQSYIVMLLPIWTLLRRYLLNDYMVICALVTLWYHANYRLCIIDYHLCSQVVFFDIWLIFCSAENI